MIRMTGKLRVCITAAAVGAALLGGPAATSAASRSAAGAAGWRQVIVTGRPGALAEVEHRVTAAGGRIGRALPLVSGVAALLPADRIGEVRADPAVRSISDDAVGHLMSIDPVLGYDLTGDDGSSLDIAQITHATDAWKKGVTGAGVDVALIDSGVVPVRGLTSGNVINGPDLSFESTQQAVRYLDTYGHGTHMASIIAGRDVRQSGKDYAASSLRVAASQLETQKVPTETAGGNGSAGSEKPSRGTTKAPRFVPLRSSGTSSGGEVVVEVGGARVRVSRGVDLALVGEVVRALQGVGR